VGLTIQNIWVVVSGLVLVLMMVAAIFHTSITPYDPLKQDLFARLKPPGSPAAGGGVHLLGTDHLGRDIFSRIIAGARVSVIIALASVGLAGTLGALIGLASGYFGGRFDSFLMRLADMQLAFPFILLAMIVIGVFGPSLLNIILVLVVTNWVTYARVVRGEVLTLRRSEFVEAARAIGLSDLRILLRHVLPNAANGILVVATLDIGRMIFFESALSFLGLGLAPPTVTWGNMLADGRLYLATGWWLATFPGLAITASILAVNFLGDWLRDRLDPRSSKL